jgi:hypothetical protein
MSVPNRAKGCDNSATHNHPYNLNVASSTHVTRLRELTNIGGGVAFMQTCSNEPADNSAKNVPLNALASLPVL